MAADPNLNSSLSESTLGQGLAAYISLSSSPTDELEGLENTTLSINSSTTVSGFHVPPGSRIDWMLGPIPVSPVLSTVQSILLLLTFVFHLYVYVIAHRHVR